MDGPVLPPVAGASLPETLEDAPERPSSRPRPSERAGEVFSDYAQEDGTLAVSALGDLLSAVDISTSPDTCMRVVTTVAGPNAGSMTRDQALAAVGMISTEPSLSRPQSQPSLSRPQSQPPPQSPSQPQPPLQPPQSPQQPQQQQQHQHQRLQQPLASLPSASSAAAAAAAALAAAAAAAAASSSPFRNEAYMPPPSAASVSAAAGPSANAILGGQGSLLGPGGESGGGLSSAGPSRPFRRILTKNRSYLEVRQGRTGGRGVGG
ncbi:hypothetical protein PLESTM_000156600 [Pleodorina starrii]|nr:hypothetical protein PLESTM_000156600 [Pleodorina starrii]